MKNGDVYEGNYKNGIRNGYGEELSVSGVKKAGIWKDGKQV